MTGAAAKEFCGAPSKLFKKKAPILTVLSTQATTTPPLTPCWLVPSIASVSSSFTHLRCRHFSHLIVYSLFLLYYALRLKVLFSLIDSYAQYLLIWLYGGEMGN